MGLVSSGVRKMTYSGVFTSDVEGNQLPFVSTGALPPLVDC
jgi:hypothetical protein